ncbi:MAG: 4Fe-4S dicluster domain-containing protein [Sulfolobales archaeon]
MSDNSILSRDVSIRRRVHVISDRCKECGLCIIVCPRKVLILGETRNGKGFRYPIIKNMYECIFCKLCEYICPELALYVS